MKTKAQIVQELLEKKAISAEEAVTLLQSDVQYIPAAPFIPQWPYTSPYFISCGNSSNGS